MTMNRQRMTWNGGDLEKDSTKHAAEAPAVPNEGPASPAYKADPGPDDYKNGDTSSWAEDPHPGPYENGEHPATPDEGTSHPAAKAASVEDLERRAAKCIRIATAMLGEGATVAAIEDQALTLMDLSDSAIKASLGRLADDDDDDDDDDKKKDDGESKGDQSKTHLDYEGDKKAAEKTAAFESRLSSVERFLSKAGYSYMQEEAASSRPLVQDMMATADHVGEIEAEDTEGMSGNITMSEEEAMLEKMLHEEGMYMAEDPGEIEAEDVEGMLQEMMAEEGMSDFNEVAAEAEAHADGMDQNDPAAFYDGGGAEMSPAAMHHDEHAGDSKGDQSKTHLDYEEAASQDPGDHDSLALPGGSMETMEDVFLEEEIVDPMGVLSTDLNEDEGDLLARLFSDRSAKEDKKEQEDHDKGAIKDDEDHIEDLKDDEKDEKKDLKKEEKKASRKPQPKKASKGAKTLGGVSKEAASEVNDLAKLWESAPDVSRFF
jgi:hypothetical protein